MRGCERTYTGNAKTNIIRERYFEIGSQSKTNKEKENDWVRISSEKQNSIKDDSGIFKKIDKTMGKSKSKIVKYRNKIKYKKIQWK